MTAPAPAPALVPVSDGAALLAEHSALPGADRLLTVEALSALLGEQRRPCRARIKPGASVLVGHLRERAGEARPTDGPTFGPTQAPLLADAGWTLLVASRDKCEGVLRRAARSGATVHEHPVPESAPALLSGGLEADPRIGRAVHRALRRARRTSGADGQDLRVLSYNPSRHAVLEDPAAAQVLRIAGSPLDRLLRLSQQWRALGVPTLALHPTGDPRTLRSARWGRGDLADPALHGADGPSPLALAAARAAGAAIARLHAAEVAAEQLAARLGASVPASLEVLRALLPQRAAQIDHLAVGLHERLPSRPRRALLHGDLSPDQVLVDPRGAEPRIRLIDLDRSGTGPLGADLGSWLAACLVEERPGLGESFLTGYVAEGGRPPRPEELAVWTARALAAASVDPARRFAPHWGAELERRLDLAAAVLADPALLPVPGGGVGPAPVVPGGGVGPAPSVRVPAHLDLDGARWRVARAWPDDGRSLPLELRAEHPARAEAVQETPAHGTPLAGAPAPGTPALRGARLDADSGEVTALPPHEDPRLPGLARTLAASPDAEIVSLRPGKRAVVRLGTGPGTLPARFVKIVRPGRAARLLAAVRRAHCFEGPFRTPAVLGADEDTVTFAALAGTTLHTPLPLEDGTWRRAWQGVLAAWQAAIDRSRTDGTPPDADGTRAATDGTPPAAEVHGPHAERGVLAQWLERARAVDPEGAGPRERAVGEALRGLDRIPDPGRPALIHRDLHDKQVLHLAGERPALLDVDTATWGDPALDLANLRAHTRWRELQGRWSPAHAAEVRALIDDAARIADIPPATLAAYEAGTLARLTCVYAFRPEWCRLARTLATTLSSAPDERTVTS
ncbi:phosphotransferase [Brachybacterium conglomeratum]|uniref:phosphotransferase n=1 Tax=Brachybacterium conglomeratum TaxID=47846 RepID=UPI003DA11A3C